MRSLLEVNELQYGDGIVQRLQSGLEPTRPQSRLLGLGATQLLQPLFSPPRQTERPETHCQIANNLQKINIKGLLTVRRPVTGPRLHRTLTAKVTPNCFPTPTAASYVAQFSGG